MGSATLVRRRSTAAPIRQAAAMRRIASETGRVTKTQVSRHLRRLREAQLVHTHRRGSVVYYQLAAAAIERLGPDLLSVLYR
ncbi:ArsR/SmtB family transcription factor [Nonomuraea sp. NPDC049400]|uniref:ArsR/SmtB family transcription factor n=1 Tax=Nonomuraea sp. NPDC049400 TaxID=3364352 RepID=UPI0037B50DB4